jgi:manganese transport protein
VVGAAIALNLLFGLPLAWGVSLTALDVIIVLFLQHRGFRYVEALVVTLILLIAAAFAIEIWMARPALLEVAAGFVPRVDHTVAELMTNASASNRCRTNLLQQLYLKRWSTIAFCFRARQEKSDRAKSARIVLVMCARFR